MVVYPSYNIEISCTVFLYFVFLWLCYQICTKSKIFTCPFTKMRECHTHGAKNLLFRSTEIYLKYLQIICTNFIIITIINIWNYIIVHVYQIYDMIKLNQSFVCKIDCKIWSVHSSGDFIGRYRATLVFYARVKLRAAFAEAFITGYYRSMLADEIAVTLNTL